MSISLTLAASVIGGGLAGYVGFGECSECCLPKRRIISGASAIVSSSSSALLLHLFPSRLPALAAIGVSTLATYLISKKLLSPSIKTGFLYKTLYE